MLGGVCALVLVGSALLVNNADDSTDASATADTAPPTVILDEDFEQVTGPLATAVSSPSTPSWRVDAGTWTVGAGVATGVRGTAPRAITTVDAGSGDVTIESTIDRITDGAGVVVRFQDATHHLSFVRQGDQYTTHALVLTDGESRTSLLTVTLHPVATQQLGVRTSGTTVELLVDGRLVGVVDTEAYLGSTRVGLVSGGPSSGASTFQDVRVTVP